METHGPLRLLALHLPELSTFDRLQVVKPIFSREGVVTSTVDFLNGARGNKALDIGHLYPECCTLFEHREARDDLTDVVTKCVERQAGQSTLQPTTLDQILLGESIFSGYTYRYCRFGPSGQHGQHGSMASMAAWPARTRRPLAKACRRL